MASLWASPDIRERLAESDAAVFLTGGYDGSGNYGDVLQLATAIETVSRLPGDPLPVPIVESETRLHHEALAERFAEQFGGGAFVFFAPTEREPRGGLEPLARSACPDRTLVYIYGGGHLNRWWGARKVAHAGAAEDLTGRRLRVVASGLQVDEPTVAPGGPAHDLLARASWIGVRDPDSLAHLSRRGAAAAGRVDLAGDDALPLLLGQSTGAEGVVNVHVNDGSWVGEEPAAVDAAVSDLLHSLGIAAGESLELQPLIAYEDPRVSGREGVARLLDRRSAGLEPAGLTVGEPLDMLDDALHHRLASFRRARLTVSCSYHVTLTSLLAGIPAVMLAHNEYYAQKAAGLRELFGLEADIIGVAGGADAAEAALEALRDGPARDDLIAHLNASSRDVTARFDRGRSALSAALADGLDASAPAMEMQRWAF